MLKTKPFRVFEGMFGMQIVWALWATGVSAMVYALLSTFIAEFRTPDNAVYVMMQNVHTIFAIIVGVIIGTGAITYFVKHGVTRKDFYIGSVVAMAALAVAMLVLAYITTLLSLLFGAVTPFTPGSGGYEFFGSEHHGIAAAGLIVMSLAIYYTFGWVIGMAFYRHDGWGGGVAIVLVVLSFIIINALSGSETTISIGIASYSLPSASSIWVVLLIRTAWLAAALFALHRMIRTTPIKLK